VRGVGDLTTGTVRAAMALTRSGVVRPMGVGRLWSVGRALARYGNSVTSAVAVGAAREPDRLAVVDDDGELSYAELETSTDRLARALVARGVGPGAPVGLLCRNGRAPLMVMCAAGKIGADVVLLNTGLSPVQMVGVHAQQRLHTVVADADLVVLLDALLGQAGAPTVVVTEGESPESPESPESLGGLVGLVASAGSSSVTAAVDLPFKPPHSRMIVLTSGTTGTPKGAKRPHPPTLAPAASILSAIPLRFGDVVHIAAPLFHTWGNAALLLAALHGSTIVLSRSFDPESFLTLVERHRASTVIAVPVMLQRVVEHQQRAGLEPGWVGTFRPRIVAVSGSALPSGFATAFMDGFGDCLYNLYGSTEVSWVSIAGPGDLRDAPGTAGRAPTGTTLVILGDDDQPVPTGMEGRVFVGNDLPFDGYTGTEATVERRAGLLGTGDTGHLDALGRLHLTGRSDDLIVSGGENVHPGPVEELICASPAVREVVVLGVPNQQFGQRLVAWVVRSDIPTGQALTADDVRDLVKNRLARFAVPRDVHFLDVLPRNPTGKVLRTALPGWTP